MSMQKTEGEFSKLMLGHQGEEEVIWARKTCSILSQN